MTNDSGEVWRDIPSLPGWQASSYGQIMRLPGFRAMPRGGVRAVGGKPAAQQWRFQRGYGRFIASVNGKTRTVAQLVCEAFHGPRPEGHECLHIDENSANNRAENLAWGTRFENFGAPGYRAMKRSKVGELSNRVKLTEAQVREIRQSDEPAIRIAPRYGVARDYIYQLRNLRARPRDAL